MNKKAWHILMGSNRAELSSYGFDEAIPVEQYQVLSPYVSVLNVQLSSGMKIDIEETTFWYKNNSSVVYELNHEQRFDKFSGHV